MKKIIITLLTAFALSVVGVSDAAGTLSTKTNSNIVINAPSNVTFTIPSTGAPCLTAGCTMLGSLVLQGAPTMSNEAATKGYVDSIAGGLIPIDGVAVASTANLTATYVNGAAGVGATLTNSGALAAFSIDGVTPAINSRILIKDQTLPAQNGIYQLSTVGSGAVAWVLTRATDYDTAAEIRPDTLVSITSGTVNAGASWYETSTVVTVGTDPINFSVFFSPSGYLQKSANLSDVSSASTSRNNLGLGTAAVQNVGFFAQVANNLSDLVSAATARTNLGLGSISTHPTTDFISAAGTVVANNVATFTNTSGNAIKDSGIQLVTYGAPSQLNLFLSAGGAGNPSLGIAAHNIGIGYSTLLNLTTGVDNTAVGYFAMTQLTSGGENVALGQGAGYANLTGNFNTAVGSNSWGSSTFGTSNTAIGYSALGNINGGSLNTAIGYQSGANYTGTESNNILIGSLGVLGESNVMRLGTVGSSTGEVNTAYWGNVNIPLSTTINTILYNSAANTVAQITPVASAVVSTDGSGVPSESTILPAGLTVPGATFTGVLNTVSNLQFTPLTVTTGTLTQSGTLITFSSLPVISAYNGAFVVPSTGNPYYVYYTGSSTTMQASRFQNIVSPTAFTLYYFNNTGFISQPSTFAISQTLFPNFQQINIGSGSSASLSVWNHFGSEAFGNGIAIGTGSTAMITSGNPTASQSGTTVTASTSIFTSDSVGRLIRFAEGNTATIRAYTNGNTVTVDKSQTISPGQQFFITGTGGTEAVSIGASGDISAGNAYIHNSLNMLSHVISNVLDPVSAQDAATKNYTDTTYPTKSGSGATGNWGINITGNAATVTTNANLTGGVTSVGNAATVITNANLTGDITSTGNATTYNNVVPLAKGGAAASLAGGSAGQILQRAANSIGYTGFTLPTTLTTVGRLLYVSASNVVSDLATAASGVLQTDASGNPSISTQQTYTPTIGDGTNNFTTSTAVGTYFKMGNQYRVTINISWTNKGSASSGSVLKISLPFTTAATPGTYAFQLGFVSGITSSTQVMSFCNGGATAAELVSFVSGSSATSILVSGVAASGTIQLTGWITV